ncbi:1,4-dihydroxy-2-naphthoate polyprenyltransferase [Effusibacillus dendaii]|uniref:1,4-dihydroxy-2-naphthoate octaprenyltransferase n=1 Tax=Effusibacillus dendaii TaxID=2743772 RepID=A0A7I8D7S5_9BACL|nr:1,4-dihydroxy-2-naphthoate polyprenyltransferase [Effusibacillus dendaii]BCJ86213.1 1,4-dihydroxy-2-naphthoate octaprenyltransferase [Effusibacillus dendaii]
MVSATTHPQQTGWRVWWHLFRPHTLTAAVIPVLVGTAYAWKIGSVNVLLFLAMFVASLLIQAATNTFNEYFDFKRGLDKPEKVGIGGAIVRHGIPENTVLRAAYLLFALALLLGVYICWQSSWWVALAGVVSMLVAYFYTGGPYPLAYTPFGELASGVFMGPVIVGIAFFIQTGQLTPDIVWISIPVMILVAAILTGNNIRDIEEDIAGGRRTLAILLGKTGAVKFLAGMFTIAYLWTVGMIWFGLGNSWLLLTLLSVPKAMQAIQLFQRGVTQPQMMPAMKATSVLHTQFGILFAIGILLS